MLELVVGYEYNWHVARGDSDTEGLLLSLTTRTICLLCRVRNLIYDLRRPPVLIQYPPMLLLIHLILSIVASGDTFPLLHEVVLGASLGRQGQMGGQLGRTVAWPANLQQAEIL